MNAAAITTSLQLEFVPIFPPGIMIGLAILIGVLTFISLFVYRRGAIWRFIAALAFMFVMLNPSIIEEEHNPVNDVMAVLIDRSASQSFGDREALTEAALENLQKELGNISKLEYRIIEAPLKKAKNSRETILFEALDQTLADVPKTRRAGVIIISDGQIHDVPEISDKRAQDYGPVHVFLTGKKNEKDRQLKIIEAPAYGIVEQNIRIKFSIEDSGAFADNMATVKIKQNDEDTIIQSMAVNKEHVIDLKIDHAGQNVIDISVEEADDEITTANNRVPLIVNGVRDRLKVLLVSGQPHAGGRTWRNLLTADPGVDLVHFTILREPHKLDATPQRELSLIAFPFRELFEVKLYDFDLIIFDRYRLNRILPQYYFANIARYVREGGALLEASGPSFAGKNSVYTTALKTVLPGHPTSEVFEQEFYPQLTETGQRHPVTQDLILTHPSHGDKPGWGPWLRHVELSKLKGHTLMSGVDGHPLLILDRVGEGRVAHLASDQIWLWARGYKGGGPQADLLRRLAHWLMKEPELEENALSVTVHDDTLIIKRRSLSEEPVKALVSDPLGKNKVVSLDMTPEGVLEGRYEAEMLGVYSVTDGNQKKFAIIGALNPPELQGVITTDEKVKDFTAKTNAQTFWLTETPDINIRHIAAGDHMYGRSWAGLRRNDAYNVTGVKQGPLLPNMPAALLLLLMVISAWWLEGRKKKAAS